MHTIDEIIIQWFNSDFGTNFSGGIFGNILLVIFSLLLAALFTGFIGIEREVHGHSAGPHPSACRHRKRTHHGDFDLWLPHLGCRIPSANFS